MKIKRFIILALSLLTIFTNAQFVYAKDIDENVSNGVVVRSRARQVNTTNAVPVGSSKYGNFTIYIKVSGVVNLNSSGNAISDSLNYSYSSKYPIKVSKDVSYVSSKVRVFYYIKITYPDGSQQMIAQSLEY